MSTGHDVHGEGGDGNRTDTSGPACQRRNNNVPTMYHDVPRCTTIYPRVSANVRHQKDSKGFLLVAIKAPSWLE